MPIESFRTYGSVEDTLKRWSRDLNYLFSNLDAKNISSTTLPLGIGQVKSYNISFGFGPNDVDASDIPISDTGGYYSGTRVESALQEIGSYINNSSGITRINSTVGVLINNKFSCNNTMPQGKYVVNNECSTNVSGSTTLVNKLALASELNVTNALLNQIRQALINNGILSS